MNETPPAEYMGPGCSHALGSTMDSRTNSSGVVALPLYSPDALIFSKKVASPASDGPARFTPGATLWQAWQVGTAVRKRASPCAMGALSGATGRAPGG